MQESSSQILWNFPGGITGLIITLFVMICIIIISYKFTLHKVSNNVRNVLIAMRISFLIMLLICIINPHIEKNHAVTIAENKKIAVVLDTSTSMNIKGFWQKSRIDNALFYWHDKVIKNEKNIKYDYFHFSEKISPISHINNVHNYLKVDPKEKIKKTFFYDNLIQWGEKFKSENYDGVVCFSDGIDTSNAKVYKVIDYLNDNNLRHVFIPSETILPSVAKASLKRIETVTKAPIGMDVNITTLIQYSNILVHKKMILSLKDSNGKILENISIKRKRNSGSQIVKLKLSGNEPGTKKYTLDFCIDGNVVDSAMWSLTRFIPRNKKKILLYQGALDWGTRFLKYTFSNDKYELNVVFAPSVLNPKFKGKDQALPSLNKLFEYDAIILLNLNKQQISKTMEQSLRKFIMKGGGVLFITGNPLIARDFANSEIEKLLPVVFSSNFNITSRSDSDTKKFFDYRNSNRRFKSNDKKIIAFWKKQEYKLKVLKLKKFELSTAGKSSPLFKNQATKKVLIPKFQDYAFVKEVKPGATVLASYKDPKGRENILMAVQQFGKGRSAVLATDPLWRWKLAIPHQDQSYNIFWKNIVLWLGAGKEKLATWNVASVLVPKNKKVKAFYDSADSEEINNVNFYLYKNKKRTPLIMEKTTVAGRYETTITPEANDKTIELIAEKKNQNGKVKIIARTIFSVMKKNENSEIIILEPNMQFFNKIKKFPTVKVISEQKQCDIGELFKPEKRTVTKKEIYPLWHNFIFYAILLGLFIFELIIRRIYKLF